MFKIGSTKGLIISTKHGNFMKGNDQEPIRSNTISCPMHQTERNTRRSKVNQHKRKVKHTPPSKEMVTRPSLTKRTQSRGQIRNGRTMTIRIDHNRRAALECSVINYWWGKGWLNRFYARATLALASTVINEHANYSVRVKDLYLNY